MDIYQETYEQIKKKVITSVIAAVVCIVYCFFFLSLKKNLVSKVEQGNKHAHPSKQEAELDMYADDFDEKEKAKLDDTDGGACRIKFHYAATNLPLKALLCI